jgi:hypothetical protein
MQKIKLSEEHMQVLEAYNDFMEALAENGINPFQIAQDKRIQMFAGAASMFNEEVEKAEEKPESIVIPVDATITEFFAKIGIIEEMGRMMSTVLGSMKSRSQMEGFAEKIGRCTNPMVMIKTITDEVRSSEALTASLAMQMMEVMTKIERIGISQRN